MASLHGSEAGWAEPEPDTAGRAETERWGEAQRDRTYALGFSRIKSGIGPTYESARSSTNQSAGREQRSESRQPRQRRVATRPTRAVMMLGIVQEKIRAARHRTAPARTAPRVGSGSISR